VFVELLVTGLVCLNFELINDTEYPWTPRDKKHAERASQGCKQYYGKNYCLRKFIKKDKYKYWAICANYQDSSSTLN
jgi:hypothetical protein